MIGLIALRKPISDILSGTFKTILGFIILSSGGGIISDTLVEYFIPAFENAFHMQGVMPTNEAVIGAAQSMFGTEMALIMGLGFLINILLRRWTKGYTIKQPNMDCQPTEITALMRHRAVFSWAEEGGIPTSGA